MKILIPALTVLALAGCASKQKPVAAPSVAPVREQLQQAQDSLTAAEASATNIAGRIGSARTKAERIDAKAVVILQNWQ